MTKVSAKIDSFMLTVCPAFAKGPSKICYQSSKPHGLTYLETTINSHHSQFPKPRTANTKLDSLQLLKAHRRSIYEKTETHTDANCKDQVQTNFGKIKDM